MSPTVIHGGFVALFRKRPPMQDGYRLLEVKVRRRRQRDKTPPWSAERRRVGGGIP